ncbi:MAG: four helix bundle protein [Flavobacteriaceae bacterium]|nr:four helix bundle protein [Flavobacteriaceae bacterium]
MRKNLIHKKTFAFSLEIIELYKELIEEKEYILSKQLLRSATSIGANVIESSAAQSKRDFIAKMSIASKEARETKYWLMLLQESSLSQLNFEFYLIEIEVIIKILTSIIKTAQENLNK